MNLKIADYFGIPLYLNLLTLPFLYFIYLTREDFGIFAVALFVQMLFFVLLHEYGHCYMARKLGWEVDSITLLPIGGVAHIAFNHINPKHEIAVALAGPAVSLVLSLLCVAGVFVGAFFDNPNLAFVFIVLCLNNTIILLFNMLPLFPSDGGRVFRGVLSIMLGYERGTWWAVRVGQAFAIVLAGVALYFGYIITGFLLLYLLVIAQNELVFSKLLATFWRMRSEAAVYLNKPELEKADLPELIAAVESIEDASLKEKMNELMPLLQDLEQSNIRL